MDDVERLIEAFRARSTWSVLSKLDALLDLEQLDDPRIVPFLLHVLADQREPTEVRIHVLKRLRNGRLQPGDQQSVAEVVLMVLSDRSSPDLRLQAVLALAEFTNIDGVRPRWAAWLWIRVRRSTFATPRSRRSNEPDRTARVKVI